MATSIMDATLATPAVLVSTQLAASETNQYQVAASKWLEKVTATLTNTSASPVTVSVSLVKASGTAGASNRGCCRRTHCPLGYSLLLNELAGHHLGPVLHLHTGWDGVCGGVRAVWSAVLVTTTRLKPLATITGADNIAVVDVEPALPDASTLYVITDAGAPRVLTITSSGTPAVDSNSYDGVDITALGEAITSMTSGLSGVHQNFQQLVYRIVDNGTARAITWGSAFIDSGVASLPTTTVVGKTIEVGLVYNSTRTKWVCMYCDAVGY